MDWIQFSDISYFFKSVDKLFTTMTVGTESNTQGGKKTSHPNFVSPAKGKPNSKIPGETIANPLFLQKDKFKDANKQYLDSIEKANELVKQIKIHSQDRAKLTRKLTECGMELDECAVADKKRRRNYLSGVLKKQIDIFSDGLKTMQAEVDKEIKETISKSGEGQFEILDFKSDATTTPGQRFSALIKYFLQKHMKASGDSDGKNMAIEIPEKFTPIEVLNGKQFIEQIKFTKVKELDYLAHWYMFHLSVGEDDEEFIGYDVEKEEVISMQGSGFYLNIKGMLEYRIPLIGLSGIIPSDAIEACAVKCAKALYKCFSLDQTDKTDVGLKGIYSMEFVSANDT